MWWALAVMSTVLCSAHAEEPLPTGRSTLELDGLRAGLIIDAIERVGGEPNAAYFRKRAESPDDPMPYSDEIGKPTYAVDVPDDYDPRVGAGVFVWISASDHSGQAALWDDLLSEMQIISISPANAGNHRKTTWRVAAAVGAVEALSDRMNIDRDRVYIGGFSGGARVATVTAMLYPEIFAGAFPTGGANHYQNIPNEKGDGRIAIGVDVPRDSLRLMRDRGRYVYFVGSEDFNRYQVKYVFQEQQREGFRVHYIEEPGLGHKTPGDEAFTEGIRFLDAPLKEAAAGAYEKGIKSYEANRLDAAYEPLMRAARHGDDAHRDDAATKASEIKKRYAADVAAIETQIDAGEPRDAARALNELRSDWRTLIGDDFERLREAIRDSRKP